MSWLVIPILVACYAISITIYETTLSYSESTRLIRQQTVKEQVKTQASVLIEAQLQRIMKQEDLSTQGVMTGLLCAATGQDCKLLKVWNKPVVAPDWAKKMIAWQTYTVPEEQGSKVRVRIRVAPLRQEGSSDRLQIFYSRDAEGAEIQNTYLALYNSNGNAFSNALTTNNHRCLLCHVEVYGNVANYEPFFLAHGLGSKIHGKWFSGGPEPLPAIHMSALPKGDVFRPDGVRVCANCVVPGYLNSHRRNITPNPSAVDNNLLPTDSYPTPLVLNSKHTFAPDINNAVDWSAWITGQSDRFYDVNMRGFEASYQGPELPFNLVRQKWMLAKVNPELAASTAKGSIKASQMSKVPKGGTATALGGAGEIVDTYNGHLIIRGTAAKPIVLRGRVVVAGDVILWGVVRGQGEIISGGNIIIPRDLTLANPPPFVGATEPWLRRMTLVGEKEKAKEISIDTAEFDRLMLMATNNIIIGSPFTSAKNDVVPFEASYIQKAQFPSYQERFAFEKSTGYALDAELTSSGDVCFVRPWSPSSNCVKASDPAANFVEIPASRAPSSYASDHDYGLDFTGTRLADPFRYSFFPREIRPDGTLRLWISPAALSAMIAEPVLEAYDFASDFKGGRRRDVRLKFAPSEIFDANTWTANSLAASLDRATGLLSMYGGYPVQNGVPGTPVETLDQHVRGYLGLAAALFRNDLGLNVKMWTQNSGSRTSPPPPTGARLQNEGMDLSSNGRPLRASLLQCVFQYTRDLKYIPNAINGFAFSTCSMTGYDDAVPRGAVSFPICGDTVVGPFSRATGNFTPPCQTLMASVLGAPLRSAFNGPAAISGPGIGAYDFANTNTLFQINVSFSVDGRHGIHFHGHMYNPAVVRPTPKVQRVDAFLFANQFVARAGDSFADSQLRVHGGMVAKDVLGVYASPVGRRWTNPAGPVTSASMRNYWNLQSEPALILMHDPRYQFLTEVPTLKHFFPLD